MTRTRHRKAALALGPFVAALDDRLAAMQAEELRAAVRSLAQALAPSERIGFLDLFGAAAPIPPDEAAAILAAIGVLEEEAAGIGEPDWTEADEWADRYGWNGNEDFAQPEWASELLVLLRGVGTIFLAGDLTTAAGAYRRLLAIATEAIDHGWSIGSERADDEVIEVATARFFWALYATTAPDERAAQLRRAVTDLHAIVGFKGFSLAAVAGALREPPSDTDGFLGAWVAALGPIAEEGGGIGEWANAVLVEAVEGLEGHAGLARLARGGGPWAPENYVAWVDASRRAADLDGAAAAATEGLAALGPGWQRAAIAERLAALASGAGDAAAAIGAWLEAWRSGPSLERLLVLVHLARQAGTADQVVAALVKSAGTRRGGPPDVSAVMRIALYLLAGKFDTAVKGAGASGDRLLAWRHGEDADGLLVPALLVTGADATHDERFPGTVLAEILESTDHVVGLAGPYSFGADDDAPPLPIHDLTLGDLLVDALHRLAIGSRRRRNLLTAGTAAAEAAVAAIVESKARGRYWVAARYAVARAEAVAIADGATAGLGVADDAMARYPRHSAYRSELEQARRRSPLLSPSARLG